tara:strand:+ start:204 stop:485 length:282 start_codon:yes stop_codon:yes gene_type:complete
MRSITLTISQLYPDSVLSKADGDVYEAWDKDGKAITVDKAAVDAEYAKQEYVENREKAYPTWESQLDYIYHNGIDKWKTDIINPIKTKYPKPE